MYSVHDYGLMLADPRSDLYAEALRRTVRPGSIVVDLGTGTGVWAVLACRLGARRVFAIEPTDVIGLAIDVARSNGVADRITFIQRESIDADIDERADVVVADVRGILPFLDSGLDAMMDARRFLSPSGILIPRRDSLFVAVVQAPAAYADRVQPWNARTFGIDCAPVTRAALSAWQKHLFGAEDLITEPARWAELDYQTLASPSASGTARLDVTRPATGHGLAVWFESDLTEGVRMSNRPGDPPLIYGQAYFPWPSAVDLLSGDRVDVQLDAVFTGTEYIFRWQSVVAGLGTGPVRVEFSQSTFEGIPLSLDGLRRQSADLVVTPGQEREVERFVVEAFDGERSQGEIATALAQQFPDRFARPAEALTHVAAVASRLRTDRAGRRTGGGRG